LHFQAFDRLPPAQLEVIEPQLLRWVRREFRLLRRHRILSQRYLCRLCSDRAIADELAKDLLRFRARSAAKHGKRTFL
jgi:hypothetical protein